jgi:hypothetical protein
MDYFSILMFLTVRRRSPAGFLSWKNSNMEILEVYQGTRKSGGRIPGIRISGKVKE